MSARDIGLCPAHGRRAVRWIEGAYRCDICGESCDVTPGAGEGLGYPACLCGHAMDRHGATVGCTLCACLAYATPIVATVCARVECEGWKHADAMSADLTRIAAERDALIAENARLRGHLRYEVGERKRLANELAGAHAIARLDAVIGDSTGGDA